MKFIIAVGLLLASASAWAQLPPKGVTAITPRLIAEGPAPVAGGTVTLAIAMRAKPGWHGYWKNPGDAGVPTRVVWELPEGVRAGALRYPVPERLIVGGLMNYVYEADYAHLVTLTVPAGAGVAGAGRSVIPLRARMNWLACTDKICVPEKGELSLDLPVGGAMVPAVRAEFDGYRAALPRALDAAGTFAATDGRLRLAVPLPAGAALGEAYFYPDADGALDYAAAQTVSQVGDRVIVETAAGTGPAPATMSGILSVGNGQGYAISAVPGVVPASAGDTPIVRTALLAFLGAVLGGLILNVMPCVFPILSLKALSLAKAGGSEADARADGLAYTGGAVLTCAALGAVLLALRASGEAAGWAFQLQEPRVILVLLLLTVAVALNLAGLFEVPTLNAGATLAGRSGAVGSFWTGALAAFVATPCTGPFLGVALGAMLVLPAAAAMMIFVGLGLGLALPFLLLGFVPALRRWLPRPGAWMDRFRRILSLPMFATALALAWVLGRQAGVSGMTIGLAAALAGALALWWLGRRQAGGASRAWVPAIPLAAASLAALLLLPPAGSAAKSSMAIGPLAAVAFDEARLASLRDEGRPVFLYFTADWCVSCKVNEKVAIDRSEVAKAFGRKNVAVMVGDWTNGDPVIGRFLEAQERSGVPLYLYYAPRAEARVLPQLLTAGMLTKLAAG